MYLVEFLNKIKETNTGHEISQQTFAGLEDVFNTPSV